MTDLSRKLREISHGINGLYDDERESIREAADKLGEYHRATHFWCYTCGLSTPWKPGNTITHYCDKGE